jgi:hypothetical protein
MEKFQAVLFRRNEVHLEPLDLIHETASTPGISLKQEVKQQSEAHHHDEYQGDPMDGTRDQTRSQARCLVLLAGECLLQRGT